MISRQRGYAEGWISRLDPVISASRFSAHRDMLANRIPGQGFGLSASADTIGEPRQSRLPAKRPGWMMAAPIRVAG